MEIKEIREKINHVNDDKSFILNKINHLSAEKDNLLKKRYIKPSKLLSILSELKVYENTFDRLSEYHNILNDKAKLI